MSDLVVYDPDGEPAVDLLICYLEEWAHNVELRYSAVEYAYAGGEAGMDFIDEITEEALDAVEQQGLDGEAQFYDDGDPHWPR